MGLFTRLGAIHPATLHRKGAHTHNTQSSSTMPNLQLLKPIWRRRQVSRQTQPNHLGQPQTILRKLPIELLLIIVEYLPQVDEICLALTCKSLWYTLVDGQTRPLEVDEPNRLIWLLEVDSPRYLSCFICHRLYPTKKLCSYTISCNENFLQEPKVRSYGTTEIAYMRLVRCFLRVRNTFSPPAHNLRSKICNINAGYLRIGFDSIVPFQVIHMMMRSWRISASHGFPLETFAQKWTKKDEPNRKRRKKIPESLKLLQTVKTHLKLVGDRLFLRTAYYFQLGCPPTSFPTIGHPGCPHKICSVTGRVRPILDWVCDTKIKHAWGLYCDGIGLSPRSCDCSDCKSSFRCLYCASEFKPLIQNLTEDGCTLVLRVWRDIGSADNPWSPLWEVNREESAYETELTQHGWEKHSFPFEKLQDIYDRGSPDMSKNASNGVTFRYL